ncbi:unnamed protein product, partial [Timema podura]|nr:unnamed protein product [Timema podura]
LVGRNHGDLLIVLQTLDTVLIRRRKKISQQRVLAFTKRLATMSTQLLHNGALGCLALIKTVMQLNKSVDILLDPDSSIGQGIYFPELDEPEYCNANSTALWELLPLRVFSITVIIDITVVYACYLIISIINIIQRCPALFPDPLYLIISIINIIQTVSSPVS